MAIAGYYKSGVYGLFDHEEKLVYIGSTQCFKLRKNLQWTAFRKHDYVKYRYPKPLLEAFNTKRLSFQILEVCNNYLEREQVWLDHYRNSSYTVVNVFDADRNGSSVPIEFKNKMSDILRERWKNPDYRKSTLEMLKPTMFKKGSNRVQVHVLYKEEELLETYGSNPMAISSRALGKTKEGSETRDTTVSPEHPPLRKQ